LLNKHFGCVRFLYNYFLQEKITQYEETQTSDNYYEQAAKLVQLKKQADTKWLKEANSQTLQMVLRHLYGAFDNFYKKTTNYPRFNTACKKLFAFFSCKLYNK